MIWGILGLGVLALILFCIFRDKRSSVLAIAFKTMASFCFVALALGALWELGTTNVPAILMIGGLVLGLIGDITLDFKIFLKGLSYDNATSDADKMTYLGMAAFAGGHVLYIAAAALRTSQPMTLLWSALVAVGAVCLIFVLSIGVMKMRFGKFLVPSIVYGLLLCWFVVFSIWQLAITKTTGNILLLVGAVMFIVSDLILSMTYFSKPEDYRRKGPLNPESKLMIVSNHVTYYIAQFFIALAIAFL